VNGVLLGASDTILSLDELKRDSVLIVGEGIWGFNLSLDEDNLFNLHYIAYICLSETHRRSQ